MTTDSVVTERTASVRLLAKNETILRRFLALYDLPQICKSHFFAGRYENIYLDRAQLPEISAIIGQACSFAEEISGVKGLRAGFWFNYMPPGTMTLPHSHDEDDEVLSAVYYVKVPKDSGDLVIHTRPTTIAITPKEGLFVFFDPSVPHEVSNNNSRQDRLSIGMNFGRITM